MFPFFFFVVVGLFFPTTQKEKRENCVIRQTFKHSCASWRRRCKIQSEADETNVFPETSRYSHAMVNPAEMSKDHFFLFDSLLFLVSEWRLFSFLRQFSKDYKWFHSFIFAWLFSLFFFFCTMRRRQNSAPQVKITPHRLFLYLIRFG